MGRKPAIPSEIKEQVQVVIEEFNKKNKTSFNIEFKGKFGYLSKTQASFFNVVQTKLGRITWTGDINKWGFAVFRYSREIYDPNEFMFPGSEDLNGTIEGALKAGIKLYP